MTWLDLTSCMLTHWMIRLPIIYSLLFLYLSVPICQSGNKIQMLFLGSYPSCIFCSSKSTTGEWARDELHRHSRDTEAFWCHCQCLAFWCHCQCLHYVYTVFPMLTMMSVLFISVTETQLSAPFVLFNSNKWVWKPISTHSVTMQCCCRWASH